MNYWKQTKTKGKNAPNEKTWRLYLMLIISINKTLDFPKFEKSKVKTLNFFSRVHVL